MVQTEFPVHKSFIKPLLIISLPAILHLSYLQHCFYSLEGFHGGFLHFQVAATRIFTAMVNFSQYMPCPGGLEETP